MSTSTKEECLSHGRCWRAVLHHMLNKMRNRVIPTQYVHLVPGLLCSCPVGQEKHKAVWKHVIDDQLQASLEKLPTIIDSVGADDLKNAIADTHKALIKYLGPDIQPLGQLSTQQRSILKMIYVLCKSLEYDFTLIEYLVYPDGNTKPVKKERGSTLGIEIIPKEMGHIIGRRGTSIKAFAQTNKCFVTFHKAKDDRKPNLVDVTIKKTASSDEEIKELEEKLTKFIAAQKDQYKIFGTVMKQNWLIRQAAKNNFPEMDTEFSEDMEKQYREKEYSIKSAKHQSNRKTRPQKSVLDNGHCLKCLKPFTSLSETSICQHHPGYIEMNNRKWSCCGSVAETSFPTYEDHQTSGCMESPTHIWRTNKKNDNKLSAVASRKPDSTILKLSSGVSSQEACEMIDWFVK